VFQAGQIGMATQVSFDGGRSWRGNGLLPGLVPDFDGNAVVAFDSRGHGFVCGITASIASLAPGLGNVTAKSGPAIAAAPCSGYLYAAVTSFDETAVSSQILLFASPDQGRTWSAPVAVAASTTEIYLQPQLAVDAAGRVGLSAYALSIADQRIDVVLYLSGPGLPRFTAPRRVTTQSFDPTLAIDTGSTRWLGNYQGLTAAGGAFHPVWTDTRTGRTQIFTATVGPAGAGVT
jgi:hypothetical protein